MNENKEGAEFAYPDSLINYAGTLRCLLGLEFRQLEGFLQGLGRFVQIPIPDYTTLQRRFNKLSIDLHIKPKKHGEPFWLAIDASGECVTNRGNGCERFTEKAGLTSAKDSSRFTLA